MNTSKKYRIVIINVTEGDTARLVLAENVEANQVKRLVRNFCGKGFTMDRRPGLHTFGSIGVKVELIQ